MAFTQEQLRAIETALARGERVVQYQDRRVEYRSVDELSRLRETIIRDLNKQAGRTGPNFVRFFHAGKGV